MEAHYGKSAEEVIALLGLAPHPEGGYYKETFRSPNTITTSSTSSSQSQSQSSNTERAACTAIYFLLAEGQRSHWHRVDAVETWLWHAGASIELQISQDGDKIDTTTTLGSDLAGGQHPQAVVPKDAWQSARSLGRWTLVSCIVAPGFEFRGFEMAPPDWTPGGESDRSGS